MINRRYLSVAFMVALAALTSSTASAQFSRPCLPGIEDVYNNSAQAAEYKRLYDTSRPQLGELSTRLRLVTNQGTYQSLLTLANDVAGLIVGGRLVITLPDGTVVVDTARNDGPGDPRNNTYDNYIAKTINENHNSRVAIFTAQQYPCGIGIETKFSTSTGQTEVYVARRLGPHLNSEGTARLSSRN